MRVPSASKPIVAARGITVHELFEQKSYQLESFQRVYAWERPEVERLVEDLAGKFLAQWDRRHRDDDIDRYEPYFLGPIIIYRQNDEIYLADGQQRVITLLLLLIQLYKLVEQREDAYDQSAVLRTLIRGDRSFDRAFAVRVDTYRSCFDSLLQKQPFSTDGVRPDVLRVWNASQYIAASCPADLKEDGLLDFIRWVLKRVSLVELDAGDPDRGKEMYVAMNDRGVRLAPLDHLKNFLLTDASEDPEKLDAQWQTMIATLEGIEKNAPLEYVRTVLRSQYFDTDSSEESSRARDETPHEWLRTHAAAIWPNRKKGMQAQLFTEWLEPMHSPYAGLLRACSDFQEGLEAVWCNALNGLTRQFDLTMAAVRHTDSPPTVHRKARQVANFIDLFVVSRGLNSESYGQADLDKVVEPLLPAARESRTVDSLSDVLGTAASTWYEMFTQLGTLRYRESVNRPFIVYLLARLTAWLEKGTARGEQIHRLLRRVTDQRPYEVEHLFTKRAGIYHVASSDGETFPQLRGRIGGLVLLDGAENASLGGLPLWDKTNAYRAYNWLAASLHPDSYRRGSARFRTFVEEQGLKGRFRPYRDGEPVREFIDERGQLYQAIAERIWAPEALGLPVSTVDPVANLEEPARRARRRPDVSLSDLLHAGLLPPDAALIGRRKGKQHRATLLADGRIRIASGAPYSAPSRAAMDAADTNSENGWTFWRVERTGETLNAVRDRYRPAE